MSTPTIDEQIAADAAMHKPCQHVSAAGTRPAAAPSKAPDWLPIGKRTVPQRRQAEFLAEAEQLTWHEPEGDHPFSPAHALMAVIAEFGIRPVEAIAYSGMWTAPDGPETATYTVLGVRTRKQRLIFVDEGVRVVPVVILPSIED